MSDHPEPRAGFSGPLLQPRTPQPRRRTTESWDVRRARIRKVGAQMLATQGIGNVALGDIIRACGVPRGSTYYYYNGWEELLTEIIDLHIIALHDRVGAADDAHEHAPPQDRLAAVTIAFMDAIADQQNEHRIQFAALHVLPETTARDLRRKHRWLAARIAEVLVAVVPELDPRPDVLVPAAMSFMALVSASVLWFRNDGPMPRDAYAAMIATMVTEGARHALAAPPPPTPA